MSLAQLLDIDARNSIARLVYRVDAPKSIGRPRVASTTFVLDRVLYLCRTGCQWAHLPLPDFVSYKTIYHRFRIWAKHRVFEDAFYQRVCSYRMQHHTPLVVDTSFVKNQYGRDVLGRNPTDRARKATKVSMLADADGVPLAFHFHPANKHDSGTIGHLLDTASRKAGGNLQSHESLYADKGYDAASCRSQCVKHGLVANIPRRGTPETSNPVRYVVEVIFGRLDKFRRLLQRYEASVGHFKALHYLGALSLVARA